MNKTRQILSIVIFILSVPLIIAQDPSLPDGVAVRKIWSNDGHNAFTSLIWFRGSFYCAFREGENHVYGRDGVARIISSKDGMKWEPVAIIKKEGYDLRDPKLSVTPDGRIMVITGGSVYREKELLSQLTHVSFSDRSGRNFSDPVPVVIPDEIRTDRDWLWRVTWHRRTGYGVVYQSREERTISLVKTDDGINYELVTKLEVDGSPNESTVRVMPDKEMIIVVRREEGNREGMWGRSKAPYAGWEWRSLGMRLGGPDFIALKGDRLVLGTRVYGEKGNVTALYAGDRSGNFRKVLTLSSGGDNSYPGFVYRKNKLYVSYYSSHEGKTSIYFAEIPAGLF